MSTEAVANSQVATNYAWVAKRIHSFVGVVPLGVYVVLHLARNVSTLAGPDAFNEAVRRTWSHPVNYLWVALLVYLPLLFHAGYGFWLVLKSDHTNVFRHFNLENVRFAFQRLSALGVLGFLFAHIFLTRVHVSMGWLTDAANPDGQVTYGYFATHMRDLTKGTVFVYALGILGVAYHLANGLSTFAISWGITIGKKSIQRTQIVALLFGLFLLALGYAAIVGFFIYPNPHEYVTPHGPLSPTGILAPLMHYKQ